MVIDSHSPWPCVAFRCVKRKHTHTDVSIRTVCVRAQCLYAGKATMSGQGKGKEERCGVSALLTVLRSVPAEANRQWNCLPSVTFRVFTCQNI